MFTLPGLFTMKQSGNPLWLKKMAKFWLLILTHTSVYILLAWFTNKSYVHASSGVLLFYVQHNPLITLLSIVVIGLISVLGYQKQVFEAITLPTWTTTFFTVWYWLLIILLFHMLATKTIAIQNVIKVDIPEISMWIAVSFCVVWVVRFFVVADGYKKTIYLKDNLARFIHHRSLTNNT